MVTHTSMVSNFNKHIKNKHYFFYLKKIKDVAVRATAILAESL